MHKISKMTNKQIDELNGLLVDYGETLTAFYDEAMTIGMREGFKNGCISGFVVGGASMCLAVIFLYRKTHKKKEES